MERVKEDLRKAATVKTVERSQRAAASLRGSPVLTYEQAYDRVLHIEELNDQCIKITASLAVW